MTDGPCALITGVTSGIGTALARLLVGDGWRVAGTYASGATAAAELVDEVVSAGGRMAVAHLDAFAPDTIEPAVEVLADALGPFDALVNNVGGPVARGAFVEVDDDVWRRTFQLNLAQVVTTTRAVLRLGMLERGRGSIVNVSSVAARTGAPGAAIHYAVCKAGLNALTQALGQELGPLGIRVNAVAPGTIDTPMHDDVPASYLERVASTTPLRRLGTPDEVVRAVRFLLSEDASFVTAETVYVTGGR